MTPVIFKLNRAAIVAGALAALSAMAACHKEQPLGDDAVAAIGGEILTADQVRRAVPAGLGGADSTAFAEAWINAWVNDRLLDHEASRHLRDRDDIDRRVADYRRNLIAWEYRRLAVATDSTLAPTDSAMRAYYDLHPDEMRLTDPLVRGIYIKLESKDPALATVRRLYASQKPDDIDRLEKVGLNSAVHYDYFRDQWIPFERIISKIPHPVDPSALRAGYKLDVEIDGFTYLLSVSDLLPAGATMPYEAAKPRIRQTLETLNSAALDAALLRRLRADAISSGRLQLKK